MGQALFFRTELRTNKAGEKNVYNEMIRANMAALNVDFTLFSKTGFLWFSFRHISLIH